MYTSITTKTKFSHFFQLQSESKNVGNLDNVEIEMFEALAENSISIVCVMF